MECYPAGKHTNHLAHLTSVFEQCSAALLCVHGMDTCPKVWWHCCWALPVVNARAMPQTLAFAAHAPSAGYASGPTSASSIARSRHKTADAIHRWARIIVLTYHSRPGGAICKRAGAAIYCRAGDDELFGEGAAAATTGSCGHAHNCCSERKACAVLCWQLGKLDPSAVYGAPTFCCMAPLDTWQPVVHAS